MRIVDGVNAQATLQRMIDARQDVDALVYGQRALAHGTALGGTAFQVGWADRQWQDARKVARRLLERPVVYAPCYGTAAARAALKDALVVARRELADAKAELAAIGSRSQLRLALKGAVEPTVALAA